MPAYHIWTLGCQMNQADSLRLAAGLERAGYTRAPDEAAAELVVINTCSVRQHAEDRAYGRLGLLRKRQEAGDRFKIAVIGCMVGPRTDDLERRFPWVDVWARPQQFDPVLELAGAPSDLSTGEFWTDTVGVPEGPAAFVPVVHGCDKFCTYCIVPLRRGRERSRPPAEVLREVRTLAAAGVREVTLLGQTVEAYGHDLGPDAGGKVDLATLFEGIEQVDGILRTRFLTSYAKDLTDRIIDAVAGLPKVCEHFNLPVQSGDDGVLARMRRGYTVAEYEQRVSLIRHRMPDVALSTDVIVGFPGETDGEFRNTIRLLERTGFDVIHVAAYSERPGTYAARHQPDDVPAQVKKERLQAVEALHADSAGRINRRLLGKPVQVLVEREEDGRSTGRTRAGQLVHFSASGLVGALAEVTIDEVTPWSLRGRLASDPVLAVVSAGP